MPSHEEQATSHNSNSPKGLTSLAGRYSIERKPIQATEQEISSVEDAFLPKNEGTLVKTSRWTLGWKSIAFMVGAYILSLITAITHALVFLRLNHERADGPGAFPQTYVATISNLLVSIFQICITAALSVSFTQYLWRVLRISALKISTIETLYGMRGNPLLAVNLSIIKEAPVILLIAAVGWLSSIAMIYPPGGLTVTTRPFTASKDQTLLVYNSTNVGNGTAMDATRLAVAEFGVDSADETYLSYTGVPPQLQRFSQVVLRTGMITTEDSPCGVNCTFSTQFDGPYLNCTPPTSLNVSSDTSDYLIDDEYVTYYNSSWDLFVGWPEHPTADWIIILTIPFGVSIVGDSVGPLWATITTMTCKPALAKYDIKTTYSNGIRNFEIATANIREMSDSDLYIIEENNFPDTFDDDWLTSNTAIAWNPNSTNWFRSINCYSFIEAMIIPLVGPLFAGLADDNVAVGGETFPYELDNGTIIALQPVGLGQITDITVTEIAAPANSSTIIRDTAFMQNSADLHGNQGGRYNLEDITQWPRIMNEALINITLSTAINYGIWQQEVNVTMTDWHNVYTFSAPTHLVVPYASVLIVSIFFLVLGFRAMHKNGVSAADNSFIQILATTTGSSRINDVAARSCLGGEENFTKELKDLKIRYGDLSSGLDSEPKDTRNGVTRRAGFGVEDEVSPLIKGQTYG